MCPFASRKQQKWMYATKPELALRFEKETPKGKKLPDKVAKKVKGKVK